MKEKHKEWIDRSGEWQAALEEALSNANSTDLLVSHKKVAFAFPSAKPNSRSFDFPSIDTQWLRTWATERGWEVDFAKEKTTEINEKWPPVRFTKS